MPRLQLKMAFEEFQARAEDPAHHPLRSQAARSFSGDRAARWNQRDVGSGPMVTDEPQYTGAGLTNSPVSHGRLRGQ
jgi:hypothetical protein